MFEQWRITLKCPLSGQRIKVPARYADCTHIECFDLEAFLRMKTQKNLLVCAICQKEVEKPLANIRIDEYIETVLSTLPDAMKVEFFSDGSFTKFHEELVMVPNAIHDDEPYLQDRNVKQDCFEDDDEHITLSDAENESTEEIVEMKPIYLMPLNMDMKPKIASSSEQIHFGDDQMIQEQHDSATHKTSQSRKKRFHLDNVSGSSVEVKGNSQPKVRTQCKKKWPMGHIRPNVSSKRAVDGETRHKCKHCHYATNHTHNLTRHMRIHTGERPYKCQFCKYAAAYSHVLINHIRIHTGEKPFKCRLCKFVADQRGDLIRHYRIHTGDKCRFCQFSSSYNSALNMHMIRKHKDATKVNAANSKRNAERNMVKKSGKKD